MSDRPFVRTVFAAVVCIALSACGGGSHAVSSLPAVVARASTAPDLARAQAIGSVTGDVVAIDAGGESSGGFAADQDYGSGTWTYTTKSAVSTSGITDPAPQAVYQSQRTASNLSYTIGGLTAGAVYTVKLSFAEIWFTSSGQRIFNVSINGTQVLSNFDVYASAGGANKALAKSFSAKASSSGSIVISTSSVKDNAIVNAIEIQTGGTTAPSTSVLINSGGSATGSFAADTDYTPGGTWTYGTSSTVTTSGVTDPAPQAVYQSQRDGSTVTYTVPGLTSGGSYGVRLDFAELYFTSAGQRVFNVSINGNSVLKNFDIYAASGGALRAVAESFSATANSSGAIVITLSAVTNNAAINGVEITSGSSTPTPTPTPTSGSTAFNDYPTFGYDNARDIFNPNSTALTPSSVGKIHLAWQSSLKDFHTQTQPILATGISGHAGLLFVGGGSGNVYAYDALTGDQVWKRFIGEETYQSSACGSSVNYFGVGGTAAYDPKSKSLYVVGNSNPSLNAYSDNGLYHLDAASGSVLGQVNFTPTAAGSTEINFSHTAVTLNDGIAYAGTGSTCDIPSWRGRVVAVNVPAMTLANTFFTVWDPNNTRGNGKQPWGGGGVWGWGGVSLDPAGNVLFGVGNTDDGVNGTIKPPFAASAHEYSGYGESLLELSANLSNVVRDNHPIPTGDYNDDSSNDLDVQGTPLIFTPSGAGCSTMVALQAKSGQLTLYKESQIGSGSTAQYQLSPSTFEDGYLGDPAYSGASGLMYAPVASSVTPTLFPPGLVAINPSCGSPSVAWHSAFGTDSSPGNPRAVPAPSAGGVVFAGTVTSSNGGDLWAIDASNGTVLNGGAPILVTSGMMRTPPTIDGEWLFVLDTSGNLYGLTIDPNYASIKAEYRAPDARQTTSWGARRR